MIIENRFTVLPLQPPLLARKLFERGRRVLLLGAPGVGKSTLAGKLGAELFRRGQSCACISADPGSPLFGVPGSVSLGAWERGGWDVLSCEALCTLDAGRFRLPLVDAVRRLATRAPPGPLLIDAPGAVRGVAGAELLLALVEAAPNALSPDEIMEQETMYIDLLSQVESYQIDGNYLVLLTKSGSALHFQASK